MQAPLFKKIVLGSLQLDAPLGIGAGLIKSSGHLEKIGDSAIGFVEIGSYTWKDRLGNEGETFYNSSTLSLNAMGLPGDGVIKKIPDIKTLVSELHSKNKKVLGSSAGMSVQEHFDIATVIAPHVDALVFNLGCPNVYVHGDHKPIQSYDLECIKEILGNAQVLKNLHPNLPIIIKLSPMLFEGLDGIIDKMEKDAIDEGYILEINNDDFWKSHEKIERIASMLNSSIIDAVIVSNTLGGVSVTKNGEYVLNFSDGSQSGKHQGGLAGPIIKDLMIAQVRSWRKLIKPEIQIIACGGIRDGKDIKEALDAGACCVQMTSAYALKNNAAMLSEVLVDYLQEQ